MGILRVTPTGLFALLALAGCIAIAVGVGMVWSAGIALIVAGVLAVGAAALLFDPKAGSRA